MNVIGSAPTYNFLQFLINAYENFSIKTGVPDVLNIGTKMCDIEYKLEYDKVPLKPAINNILADETYTYLMCTGSNDGKTYSSNLFPSSNTKIMGIKTDSSYLKLLDNRNNDLINLIKVNSIPQYKVIQIIANEFSAYKYNLHVGDNIAFDIDNKTNRFMKVLYPDLNTNNHVVFKVVGINTTYEGEEYFIDQQVANYLLGLRSKLASDNIDLHQYYQDSNKCLGAAMGDGYLTEAKINDINDPDI
jgi:hypothetical protein